jgi:transcription initiation factor TFIIIB Brf1 subunit/transcription initiation factor TFIIB
LELPAPTIRTAEQLFQQYHNSVDCLGRSWEAAEAAALYAAIRVHEEPVSRQDLVAAIDDHAIIDESPVKREIKRLKNVVDTPIPAETVEMMLGSMFDELEVDERTERVARDMANTARETGYLSGNTRRCVAAGIAYSACKAMPWEAKRDQKTIANAADATDVSVRKHYHKLTDEGITPDETDVV